ncbi:MAG TPA: hypothetical protein VK911_00735, partial [Vicinamibacterales bacterium]|nr:hypothetical protein [Vicinamibacterales bacterium]
MRRPALQWVLAILITLTSAVWQRMSGPTYPVRGTVDLGGQAISVRLQRTHSISARQPVVVRVPDAAMTGDVRWRLYPTDNPWQTEPLRRRGDELRAEVPPPPAPLMPPAGKLEYQVRLHRDGQQAAFPEVPAVTRFKGDVAAVVLTPHILAMFVGMLLSTRAGLAAIFGGRLRLVSYLTFALLLVGGLILGPVVQKMAFGAYWTGVPWGWDLTDNKTLIAAVAWM